MFNLTRDERKVILFLASLFLLGLGVNFWIKGFAPLESPAYFSGRIGKINLNTADKKLLMSVSGIGDKLSERIIEVRDSRGSFERVEDLKEVKGITESKFNKIRDYLIVE
jgi:competence ComEA-like helix-hairpin-helix protein